MTEQIENARRRLKMRRVRRIVMHSAEVAQLQPKIGNFNCSAATSAGNRNFQSARCNFSRTRGVPAGCNRLQRKFQIFSPPRRFSICSVKLQPNSRNFSRTHFKAGGPADFPPFTSRFGPTRPFTGCPKRLQPCLQKFVRPPAKLEQVAPVQKHSQHYNRIGANPARGAVRQK